LESDLQVVPVLVVAAVFSGGSSFSVCFHFNWVDLGIGVEAGSGSSESMSTGIEELGPLGFCDCEVKGGDSGGAEDANADEVDESSDNRAGAGARRVDLFFSVFFLVAMALENQPSLG
jgi:hypothetical protein